MEQFEISYRLDTTFLNTDNDTDEKSICELTECSLVPSLLPEARPDKIWSEVNESPVEASLMYQFDFLPPGLFSRLLVRMHRYTFGHQRCWRHGALLSKNKQRALLELFPDNRYLFFLFTFSCSSYLSYPFFKGY